MKFCYLVVTHGQERSVKNGKKYPRNKKSINFKLFSILDSIMKSHIDHTH